MSTPVRIAQGKDAPSAAALARLEFSEQDLSKFLGFHSTYLALGHIEAEFEVLPQCCRGGAPKPLLHGGVSLAFAENCAGIASMLMCPPEKNPCGIKVCGQHKHMAFLGERLHASCDLVSNDGTYHVWKVDIRNAQEQLISTVEVTNKLIAIRV